MPLRRCRRSRRPTYRSFVHRVTLRCQPRFLKSPPFLLAQLCATLKRNPTTNSHRRSTWRPSQTTTPAGNVVNRPVQQPVPAPPSGKTSSAPKFVSSAAVFVRAPAPSDSLLVFSSDRRVLREHLLEAPLN